MDATSPVTGPCLAMRSRYFGTGSWKYLVVWVGSQGPPQDRQGRPYVASMPPRRACAKRGHPCLAVPVEGV